MQCRKNKFQTDSPKVNPPSPTKQVVEDNKPGGEHAPKNDVEQFVNTYNSARALYNEV